MIALMEAARSKGLEVIEGEVLSHNHNMLKLMNRIGFSIKPHAEDTGIMQVSKRL